MARRITAREMMNTFTPGDYNEDWEGVDTVPKTPSDYDYEPVADLDEFWSRKLQNAQFAPKGQPSLYDSIKKEGQKKPISVNMETKEIIDGHHRLVSIHHINPNQFVKYRSWKP